MSVQVMALYDKLGVKKHALTLIQPQFETPMPPLQPAVFPPAFKEPAGPALELFDLDEEFASEHVRLAVLLVKQVNPQTQGCSACIWAHDRVCQKLHTACGHGSQSSCRAG